MPCTCCDTLHTIVQVIVYSKDNQKIPQRFHLSSLFFHLSFSRLAVNAKKIAEKKGQREDETVYTLIDFKNKKSFFFSSSLLFPNARSPIRRIHKHRRTARAIYGLLLRLLLRVLC